MGDKAGIVFYVDLEVRDDFQEAVKSAGEPSASWVLRRFVERYVKDWQAKLVAARQLEGEDE